MSEQHTARVARLFRGRGTSGSGGLALPEVFREVLTMLLDDGPTPRLILHKIIRDMLTYKSERVADIWGSWERFCDDLLFIMAYEGYLEEYPDSWALGDRAVPGEQLTVAVNPENPTQRIRVTFTSRKEQEVREIIATAWRNIKDFSRLLEQGAQRSPVLAECLEESARIGDRLQRALSAPEGTLQPAPSLPRPARKGRKGKPVKERNKPAPPDQPDAMRACIGTCRRVLPLVRDNFECYWSERMLASGKKSGDWYWRWDCRQCHTRSKSTAAGRDQAIRKVRKEELRIRIAELGEPYPSAYRFATDLHMDAGSVRKVWQELHEEGKAPPVPPPPPSYPRPPRVPRQRER